MKPAIWPQYLTSSSPSEKYSSYILGTKTIKKMFEENKDDFSPPEEDLSGEETVTAGLVLHSDPLHLHQTVTHLLPAL